MPPTGRRLLFFFDGTSERAAGPVDVTLTNAFRLNQEITFGFNGTPQIAFYFAGVGTRGDGIAAATGRGFDQIVIESFINLSSNYMEGDHIYLFGFSRGAAAARALSSLLSVVGLLNADNLAFFPEVWEYFVDDKLRPTEKAKLRKKFQPSLVAPAPRVEFLGCFDTVAGSGWDRINLFTHVRLHNARLEPSVRHAVQILSIDDDRNPSFSPSLWAGKSTEDQTLEQVWMPGVHADIGGCSDAILIGNIALLTMIERVKQYCPEVEWDQEGDPWRVVEAIRQADRVEITYERPKLGRKLLAKAARKIGGYSQFIHPIFEVINGKTFSVKGSRKIYVPLNYDTNGLPEFCTKHKQFFEAECRRALALS